MKIRICLVYNRDGVGEAMDSVILEGKQEDLIEETARIVAQRKPDDYWSEELKTTAWTVLGVYEEDGSTFYYNIPDAKDAHEAMRIAASDAHYDDDLCIIGAIAGDHELIDACEDSKKSCYACDLEPEDET